MDERPRIFPEPVDTDAAALDTLRAQAQARRAAMAAARAASRPARAVVLGCGPVLRDFDAALECLCACHPRVADLDLHDGGTTCPCQQTAAERRALLDALWADARQVDDITMAQEAADAERMTGRAAELDVELIDWGGVFPFVLRARVDGRGCYLRERGGHWSVVMAGDDTPGIDIWMSDRQAGAVELARGEDDELARDGSFDPVVALEVTAAAVRRHLLRRRCAHARAERWCPECGQEMQPVVPPSPSR